MSPPTLESLYIFAVFMLGDRKAAFEAVCSTTERAPSDSIRQLAQLVADLVAAERPAKVDHFGELDDVLRLDTTVPVDLDHPLVQGDARRLGVLLAELQRTCLMSTLRGIPTARRAVFILRHILGLSLKTCVEILGTSGIAVRALESRARKTIEEYLFPRCEHPHRLNPCHCAGRLGGALEKRFITWPTHHDFGDMRPPGPYPGVEALFAALPRVRLPILHP